MDWQIKVGLGVAVIFGLLPFAVTNMPRWVRGQESIDMLPKLIAIVKFKMEPPQAKASPKRPSPKFGDRSTVPSVKF
jgi:hypothetical protein